MHEEICYLNEWKEQKKDCNGVSIYKSFSCCAASSMAML